MSAGSVDGTGTYVFETPASATIHSMARTICYWQLGDGVDTMFTIWNHGGAPEDLLLTFDYDGGEYSKAVHLEAKASVMLSLEDLIARQEPDVKGRFLPVNLTEGSAKVSGSRGEVEHIDATVAVASYNVNKATCNVHCISCSETSYYGFFGLPDPISFAIGATQQATATGSTRSGGSYDVTRAVQWSSANTAVATVGTGSSSPGMAIAVAPGSTTLTFESLPVQDQGQDCGDPPECPAAEADDIDLPVQVYPVVNLKTYTDLIPLATGNVAGAINTFTFTATGDPAGGTFSWASDSGSATLNSTSGSSVTVTAASVGKANLTVTYTVNGQPSSQVEAVSIVQPNALTVVSDSGTTQDFACVIGYNGDQRTVGYQITGGGSSIAFALPIYESFNDISNTCGEQVSPNPPASNPKPASSQGTFTDYFQLCSSACLPPDAKKNPTGSCTYKTQHQWYANGFSVFNQTLTYTCTTITPQ